jgi:pyrroline-5-carboxylate reductase
MTPESTPVLLIGAGRMGGALIAGWKQARAFDLRRLMVRAPHLNEACAAAALAGASVNPDDDVLTAARAVVLCVKPQKWSEVAALYAPLLSEDAVIVSVLVGTRAGDVSAGFGGRPVARVLPTTAVASASGVTSLYAPEARAAAVARALFEPLSTVVELKDEPLMDVAGAVSASGAAYVYAFARALETAGVAAGLPARAGRTLAQSTVVSAAAFMGDSGLDADDLIAQVASPGGTTQAALTVLDPALRDALEAAVAAAVRRAQELAG